VLACTGLKAIGGVFMGRFDFGADEKAEDKRRRAEEMVASQHQSIDLDGVLTMDDLVRSDEAAFIACGVTDGEMLEGVHAEGGSVATQSILMNAEDRTVRFVKTIRRGDNGLIHF
jgi:fructose-1,6-bisphosphatase/sedoheptulose 1,7-bisphosphatase-like protein